MQTMEELIQSDPQTNFNNEEDDDDEIYEKIEAPKFVDFTDPNPPHVLDDRSWFCLRVGCDLKHEEDMDPDAVYKRFVLRVMAARSPNLRLRKALLNKQAPSATLKCPLTAPAKSSKPRVSRMTAITNLSQRMADAKVKLHPISKLNLTTPHGKAKQIVVASKYLTTPRYKKCIPERDPFRSVQNPKNVTAMTRGKLVAKALVFKSPKKTQKRKTVLECQTPVTEVCSEMKKLEISSQPKKTQKRKASLECQTPVTEICSQMKKLEISKAKKSGKPSSSIPRGLTTCQTASEAKKSQLYNHNQKSRVEIDHKDQEAKSSRRPKRKSKEKIQKVQCAAKKNPDNDLSDMEIDEKSRKGSMDVCSTVESSNSKEERLVAIAENLGVATTTQEENFSSSSETSLNGENRQTLSTDVTTGECPSLLSTSEIDLEEKDPHKFETPDEVKNESIGHEESVKSNTEEERLEPASTTGSESEAMFSDDKENALASEVIFTETEDRESILNCDNSQVKIHPHDSHDQKVNGVVTKTLKGSSNVAVTVTVTSLGGKYKKAKPTNPKPFRLRTDERGVLREAKLLAAPQREIAPVSKVPDGGDPQRRHGNEIQDLKSNGECRHENDSQEGNQAESDKIIQKIRPRQTPSYLKALKRVIEPKMSTATAIRGQKKLEDGKAKAAKKWDGRTTAKSPLLRQQLVKSHQRVVRTRNATVTLIKPGGLGIIKESSTTVLRPIEARPEVCGVVRTRNATVTLVTPGGLGIIKESSTTVLRPIEAKPEVCGTTPTSIPTHTSNAGAAARSTSRGKRPPTIPKEPNFHKIHTPKSCTKTPIKVISS